MINPAQYQILSHLQHQRMKINIKFALIIFFTLNALVSNFAQVESEKPKKMIFSEVKINRGFVFFFDVFANDYDNYLGDLPRYFDEQAKVETYFSELGINKINFLNIQRNNFIQAQLGFKLLKKENKYYDRLFLKLGISYHTNLVDVVGRGKFAKFESNPIFQNPSTYTIYDSIIRKQASIYHQTRSIYFQPVIETYTNPKNQIQFYTGFSLGGGVSIANRLNLIYRDEIQTNSRTFVNNILVNELNTSQNVRFEFEELNANVGTQYTLMTYIPLGINFRFGVDNRHTKRMHAGFEMRPTLMLHYSKNTAWISRNLNFINLHCAYLIN
jgi:hypothetical protein